MEWANMTKPDYIGFVFAKSRRQVSPEQAGILRKALDPSIVPVGVFVDEEMERILSLTRQNVIGMVQLHGHEDEAYIEQLKSACPVPVIKTVHMRQKGDVQQWRHTAADYLLLDHPGGGTGECFDWQMIDQTDKPFFLAGGLHVDNIRDAIRQANPFAVDISSGVETNGYKDLYKMQAVIRRIREDYE